MTYRLGITGSRSITSVRAVGEALARYIERRGYPTCLVEGDAPGVDRLAAKCCRAWGIEVDTCRADWYAGGSFNPAAGYERNIVMAKKIDCLLALWDGKSRGTKHMIDYCRKRGLDVVVEYLDLEGDGHDEKETA